MHSTFYFSSCEALRGSILAVGSECVLMAVLAKQGTMVVLRQWLNTRGKEHTLLARCWHAAGTLSESMLTHAAMLYGCSPCNDACMPCASAAGVSAVARRRMGWRVVDHGSVLTVIHRVRL